MQYLKLPFFVPKPSPGLETTAIQAKFAPVNVAFIDLGDFSQAAERFQTAGRSMECGRSGATRRQPPDLLYTLLDKTSDRVAVGAYPACRCAGDGRRSS